MIAQQTLLTKPQKTVAAPPVTAEELLQLSTDSGHRYALMRGELIVMDPAGYEHGDYAMGLGARMRVFVEDYDLGRVYAAETGFLLEEDPDTVQAPDAAFVRKDRFPITPVKRRSRRRDSSYFPGAPDIAVEVVSPDDTASAVQAKVQTWLRFGSQLVWVIEPRTRTLTIHRPNGTATVLQQSDTLDGEDVLPGFRYELKRLFI